MREPLLIGGGHIIDPSQGLDIVGDLLIAEDKVAWVGESGSAPCQQSYTLVPAQGMVISPGFVDLHCHLREPGFEEKETIATGTQAAARGGFTTLCCMPNTEPPIDTPVRVRYIRSKAEMEGVVHVFPIGCITQGRKGEKLANMEKLAEAGVVGFSDNGNPVTNSCLMRYALEHGCRLGLPIIEHCEDTSLTKRGVINEGWVASRLGLKGIPAAAEEAAVTRDIALAEMTHARLHIAHVSSAGSVELIRRAKEKGINITAEVTPHHLTLTEEKVEDYDTNAKVNPPLRTKKDIEALIQGLKEGMIDAIATDHSPHTMADKQCEFALAAFGISGLETAFGSLMSLVHNGEIGLMILLSKLAVEPARILEGGDKEVPLPFNNPIPRGLGTLRIGAIADITIFDPEAEWVVDPQAFASKGKNTPWAGRLLKGKVMATVVGGKIVYKDEAVEIRSAGL